MRVYFCVPHSPWQHGTCENTNGLLRQFLPKGTDPSVHDQDALDCIADLMNNRLRQMLGWDSPYQAFSQLMQALQENARLPFTDSRPPVLHFGVENALVSDRARMGFFAHVARIHSKSAIHSAVSNGEHSS